VTGRGWTARQPDETPVGELPLRPGTIRTLWAAGVLTLGELRAMDDHDLLLLRHFGCAALADVRFLVPAPPGSRVASAGSAVAIADRTFTVGTVYAPRPRMYGHTARAAPVQRVCGTAAHGWKERPPRQRRGEMVAH
jgi:hypothetical protein